MKKAPRKATMIGYQPFGKNPVGFALPLFSHPTQPSHFTIQNVDEISGRVVGFLPVEQSDTPYSHFVGPSLEVGDEQVFAFIADANDVRVGTLDTLRSELKRLMEVNILRRDLALQIAELIGTADEKKTARIRMQKLILKTQGASAAHSFYEGSVLRAVVWSCLVAAAPSQEIARRVLAVRGRLSANITPTGTISLDLSALSTQDRESIDSSNLLKKILLEFEPDPNARPETILSDHNYSLEISHSVQTFLQQISQASRQEERISLLLSAILDNPLVGKSLLLQYNSDKAKFANWAITEIRQLLLNTDWASDEKIVASLISKLFTQQFPTLRGRLLLSLAQHLGKWPLVNEAIRKNLARTHSMFVNPLRKEIEEELSRQSVREPLHMRIH